MRSSTSPVSGSTARPSLHTHPSAMCAAPMQYERSTTSSSGSPAATRTSTRSIAPVVGRGRTRAPASASLAGVPHARCRAAPRATRSSRTSAARSTPASSSAPSTSAVCSASPSARSRRRSSGPATASRSQSSATRAAYGDGQTRDGATRRRRSRRRCAPRRRATPRSPRSADASVRAARSPRASTTTRTARPCSSASSRAAAGRERSRLAAERAAVRERARRLAAGFAPRRVGLEVGGLDPARREAHTAVGQAAAAASGGALVDGRAPTLHLARELARASASDSATTHVAVRAPGTATSASRGAVSSAKPASPHGTSGPTRWATPPSSSARRAAASKRAASTTTAPRRCAARSIAS